MNGEPLVSIITPCYNGERFVEQYTKSILNNDYGNIELIFVNDGSLDNTKEKIMSYYNDFVDRGISFKYIDKQNGGAASAVQVALSRIEGDYIFLFDIDDILYCNAISSKVKFLEQHVDYGMVRSNGIIVPENNLNEVLAKFVDSPEEMANVKIFENLLYGKTNNWPGSYMIRTDAFKAANKGLDIYISQYGQNLQMMLPVAYRYKCGFIDEIQMKYIVYENSHSHSAKGGAKNDLRLLLGYIENRKQIIKKFVGNEYDLFCEKIDIHFSKDLCLLGYAVRDKNVFCTSFRRMMRNGDVTLKETGRFLIVLNPFLDRLVQFIRR